MLRRVAEGLAQAAGGRAVGSRHGGSRDPFSLDPQLFEYVTHVEQHGEAFAGYRVKGHAMVLEAADGTALASLHIRPEIERSRAIIARRPDDPAAFLGVFTEDDQSFTIVLTNLTTDGVMMMDVGGEQRHREPAHWGRTDKDFWSGRHRNDSRLNRSNILWPMVPNVCEQSFVHFQQTGESRQLRVRARGNSGPLAGGAGTGSAALAGGVESNFPIFAYAKHGGRGVGRFDRCAWACPEIVAVVGTPALLDGASEEHNIQYESPLSRRPGEEGPASAEAVIKAIADTYQVTPELLLEAAGVDGAFLSGLPPELAHELLLQQLDEDEARERLQRAGGPRQAGRAQAGRPGSQAAAPTAPPAPPPPPRPGTADSGLAGFGTNATPAEVVVGDRVRGSGVSRLLIEKFDFGRPSAPARLRFGVHQDLQLQEQSAPDAAEQAEVRRELEGRIEGLRTGRREALMGNISDVYDTPECVICLSGDPKPDAVLYQCGHKCVHLACVQRERLRRCPLCRHAIAAILPE